MKWLSNLDLRQCELQNFRVQNLAVAPENPVIGQHYYNTVTNTEYVWNGTAWIDALSQGDYTFQNGLELAEGTRNVQIKLATGNNKGDITFVANANGLKADVDLTGYAKASEASAIEATDTLKDALGKLEAKADEKVIANADITAGTHTKITYDAKGLVTAGADLSEADIPELGAAKTTNLTGYAKASQVANVAAGDTLLEAIGKLEAKADEKVVANNAITADTHTKITYDEKGLVTAGADLSAADIPNLDGAKINTLANYAKASEARAIAIDDTLTDALGKLEYKADAAVVANTDITGATHTKITYDAKGLVTAGADLSEADIPTIDSVKVGTIGSYVKASQVADLVTTDSLNDALGKLEAKADEKVVANADITGATKCKITYDEKGLVTAGADLSEADIPTLGAAKIGNLTGYAKASQVAALAAGDTLLEALGKIQASLDSKIGLTAVSIESASEDYLTYDNTTGEIGAKVSTTIVNDDTNLVTGEAVYEAIKDHITLTDISIESGSTDFAEYNNTTGEISIKGGVANGLATLDANGLVPSTQLPSYVDDVLDLVAIGSEPATANDGDRYYNSTTKKIYTYSDNAWGEATDPETGKIYVANDMAYRWSGTAMVQIGADKLKGFNGTIEGDGTTTTFTINHNLGTRNVVFEIYEASSPYEKVYVQVNHTSTSAVQVIFGAAPAVGEDYIITIIAIG